MEISTWGLHNHIIEVRLKIRMTEDLIDCAQRLEIKADKNTQRELKILKTLRDQTYEDLKKFVQKREKRVWRNWHVFGQPYKPIIDSNELSLAQIMEKFELNYTQFRLISPKLEFLVRDIQSFNMIICVMITFIS